MAVSRWCACVMDWRRRRRGLMKHARAQTGSTALIWAGRYGQLDCLRLLLNAGADMNAADKVRASRSTASADLCLGGVSSTKT